MDKIEYGNIVNDKLNELILDFKQRVEESIDDEFIYETRLSEIKKLWEITDYRIGFSGNTPVYESGPQYNSYIELSTGKQDYNSDKHLEFDTYWHIGRLIIEEEQNGKTRAGYGKYLIKELSNRLTKDFGKGYDQTNLKLFRKFYLEFPIWQLENVKGGMVSNLLPEFELLQKGDSLCNQLEAA